MDPRVIGMMGAGLVMGISSLGAAIAMGVAGSATVGAWKRCYKANKPAPMTLLTFVGFPLTEVFYGFILMSVLMSTQVLSGFQLLGVGLFAGLAIGGSAYAQGCCSASASDAYAETEQGFGNYMLIIGLCETVALFVMVFAMLIA